MAHLQTLGSSSVTSCNYNYDVFINHYGPEVRKTLSSHLYRRLLLDGFRVFMGNQEIQAGASLNSQTEGAIATASVHIAIFSSRYGESKSCLDELLQMLKSKAPVIPVFYHVKPSDLRIRTGEGEDGVYARALRDIENKKRYEPKTVQIWRDAFSRVADISGLELEACNGDEGELVEQVVERVEKKVTKTLSLAAHRIGLDKRLEDFENTVLLYKQQHGVQNAIVGIVGPGGIGKTAMAMEFFKRRRSDYNRSCFLSDVREAAGRYVLPSLQIKLVKDLSGLDLEIVNIAEGKKELSRHFSSSQALIILDDVDDVEHLLAFVSPRNDVLRSGSLIIVISRSENVLTMSGIKVSSIYKLPGLNKEHSRELFSLHAFHKRFPAVRYEEIVREFLDVCNGSPLALKVLGALVYQKDMKYWKTSLGEISVPPADIKTILKISYEGLDSHEKEMFLDIACFFINEDKDMAIRIWDASGWEGRLNLENLESNCLVKIDGENCIRLHDHLRDFGRDLAEKERFKCRLWRPTDNLFHSAFQKLTVRGINMVQGRSGSSFEKPVELSNSFVDMSRLQLLRAEGDCLENISNLLRHSDLLWLCWNCYPYTTLPSWIPVRNLRVLQLDGDKLETLWQTESEELSNLQHLGLSGCSGLQNLPDSLGNITNLQHLGLPGCSGLQMLPNSLGNLINLHHLDLYSCSGLQMLPNSLGNLTNLQHLDLSSCSGLRRLPGSLGNLTNLQHLDLSSCYGLRRLPDSLGKFTNLQHLDLSSCSGLRRLPDSLGKFTNLQHLDLSSCSDLRRLPNSLGNLTNLQHLDLSSCSRLEMLPDKIWNLTYIQHLDLSACSDLRRLPDSLGNLTNLQHLDLSACSSLQMLPDSFGNPTNLQHLDLSLCSSLQMLPDSFGNLTNLQHLDLSFCSSLQMLPDSFGNLTNLQHLDLSLCSSLQMLPDSYGNLTNLQHLDLSLCSSLQMLPDSFGNLINLQHLDLSSCFSLQMLPDSYGNLTNLQHLNLYSCSSLQMLPDSTVNLTNLQHLDLSSCSSLQMLPDSLANLRSLRHLDVSLCFSLQMLPDSPGILTKPGI